MDEQLNVTLSKALRFSDEQKGEMDEAWQIKFREPTYHEMKDYLSLKSSIMQAILASQKERQQTQEQTQASLEAQADAIKSDDFNADTIMSLVAGYGDLEQVVSRFCKFAPQVGMVTEGTKLKEAHIKEMPIADIEKMCGEYLAFFIAPSIIRGIKEAI